MISTPSANEIITYDFLQQYVEANGGGSVEVYRPTASNFSVTGYQSGRRTATFTLPSGGTWYTIGSSVTFATANGNLIFSFALGNAYFSGGSRYSDEINTSNGASATFSSTSILLIKVA